MKTSKDLEQEKQETKNDDESYQKTDKELFAELMKSDEEDKDENRIVANDDEDFVEVDGVKITPFSIKKELKEGKFDANGNYIQNEEEDKSYDDSYSSDTQVDEKEEAEALVKRLKEIIELIPPQNSAQEALQASNNDEKRLIKITDCATDLLSLGLTNIYRMTLDDLKKELDD